MLGMFKKTNKQTKNVESQMTSYGYDPLRRKFGNVERCESIPDWVEHVPGFKVSAWILNRLSPTYGSNHVYVLQYSKVASSELSFDEPEFSKIVFTMDGVPFKQMGNMYKEMRKCLDSHKAFQIKHGYVITDDGRMRDRTGCFAPDEEGISDALDDLAYYYEKWWRFPEVEDYKVVEKLCFAYNAIERMERATESRSFENAIQAQRNEILSCQKAIEQLEREQNEMYEKAAEAMDYFEAHGIDPKKVKEDTEQSFKDAITRNMPKLKTWSEWANSHYTTKVDDLIDEINGPAYALAP